MKSFIRALWHENNRISITKLMAVLTTLVVLYRAGIDATPDWSGMGVFMGAAWGMVQARKVISRGDEEGV